MTEQTRAIIWAAVSTRSQVDEEEKFSIPKQIEDGERFCREQGYTVIDTLVVPGHSRSYRTLDELATAARTSKENIVAFDKLIEHFKRKDFDVFICRDANRFARKASLLHYIVETIIEECGATIFSQNDNFWVNADNMDMWATMQGYKVRAEVKTLVRMNRAGMKKRAARGLPSGVSPFWTHKVIRDDKGKAQCVVLDEGKRRLFDDIATLLLEGLPLSKLGNELFERFGHVHPKTGKAYHWSFFGARIHNPAWWGHSARNWSKNTSYADLWSLGAEFEADFPPPEGTEIWRDVLPPVWEGEIADRIKGELLRRRTAGRGRAHSGHMHIFSGLLICGSCGSPFGYNSNNGLDGYMYCNAHRNRLTRGTSCTNSKGIRVRDVHAWFDKLLSIALEQGTIDIVVRDDSAVKERALLLTRADLDRVQKQITRLTAYLSEAPDELVADVQQQLATLNEQRRQLRALEAKHLAATNRRGAVQRTEALDDIRQIRLDKLWQYPSDKINQKLHYLLGNRRPLVDNGVILDAWTEYTPRRGRHRHLHD